MDYQNEVAPVFDVMMAKGQMKIFKPEEWAHFVATRKDGAYQLLLRRPKRVRSLQQNAYFHGVAVKIFADETGHSPSDIKDLFKTRFLRKEIVVRGKTFTIVRHSADLDTIEFNEFVERVREFAARFDINIPLPNEVDLENYQTSKEESDTNGKYNSR